ncbi:MAG: hypothetical protein ABEJ58_08095 [Halodesulfurarchaeum sp.]
MRFRTDRRARIPFAVLGALLLLTSTLYASTATPGPIREPVTPALVDQAQIQARMALDTAIREASQEAAHRPVIQPASTRMGSILRDDRPYRSYLRLLVALHSRDNLHRVRAGRSDVSVSVRLPPIYSRTDALHAINTVEIAPTSGNRYRVHISDLRVIIRRHGRRTDTIEYETNLTVPIPALLLHDRVSTFERRLNAGLLHPGFTQDLTVGLFATAWTRGYAQYAGAPIQNVIANRHVEVLANRALLSQQAAVFGRSSRDARRATRRAATNVFVRDSLLIGEEKAKSAIKKRVEKDVKRETNRTVSTDYSIPSSFDHTQSYTVDRTADEAFVSFVEDGDGLDGVLYRVYQAEVRADFDADYLDTDTFEGGHRPANTSLVATFSDTDRRLLGGHWTTGSNRILRSFDGRVVVEDTTTRYWMSNTSFGTTTHTRERTYAVDIDLTCRYEGASIAPDRPMPVCPFGEVARNGLEESAYSDLVTDAGGVEHLAIDAVRGSAGTDWETVRVEPPQSVRESASDQVATLRERVRSVSVTLTTRSVASSANPASLLSEKIRRRHDSLIDPPYRYWSVADRAETAARVEYLESVRTELDGQTPVIDRVQQELVSVLGDHVIPLEPPKREPSRLSGIASSVEARPIYLSVRSVEGRTPAMVARNLNVFAVPYGDAADVITSGLFGDSEQTTSLSTAARTLQSLEAISQGEETASIRTRRRSLRWAVKSTLDRARGPLRAAVVEESDAGTAEWAVRRGYGRFDSTTDRALAIVDGRMATVIADIAADRDPSIDEDLLRVKLRVVSSRFRDGPTGTVKESVVSEARSSLQTATNRVLRDSLRKGASDALETARKQHFEEAVGRLPAGLPLVPVPGYWYATANAWVVQVRGSYTRFAVATPRSSPVLDSNGTVTYVRNRSVVRLDVDGDGSADRLGRNKPITFRADTGVVVVVPPGRSGVGDLDGNVDERSPGWGTWEPTIHRDG